MVDRFLERFNWAEMWVKRLFAKMSVDKVFESMVVFLNVLPNRIRQPVLHQSNGKSDLGCWRACCNENVRVVGNVIL